MVLSLVLVAAVGSRRSKTENAQRQLRQIARLIEVWQRDPYWLSEEVTARVAEEGVGNYPIVGAHVIEGIWRMETAVSIDTGAAVRNLELGVNAGPYLDTGRYRPLFASAGRRIEPLGGMSRLDVPSDLDSFRAAWNALEELELWTVVEFGSGGNIWFSEGPENPRRYRKSSPVAGAESLQCLASWASQLPSPDAESYIGHGWFSGRCYPKGKGSGLPGMSEGPRVWVLMRLDSFHANGQERLVARQRRKFEEAKNLKQPGIPDFDLSDWRGGAFEASFRDLHEIMSDIPRLRLDQASALLEAEARRATESLDLWGIRFPARWAFLWASWAVVCVQLYLFLHLGGMPSNDLRGAAWIGAYSDRLSTAVNYTVSGVLPLVCLVFAALQQRGLWIPVLVGFALAAGSVLRLRRIVVALNSATTNARAPAFE